MEKKKKMKRIEAIIKGRKFTETLFGLKKKQIRRALEAAEDNVEKQKEEAAIAYEGFSPAWPKMAPTIRASSERCYSASR